MIAPDLAWLVRVIMVDVVNSGTGIAQKKEPLRAPSKARRGPLFAVSVESPLRFIFESSGTENESRGSYRFPRLLVRVKKMMSPGIGSQMTGSYPRFWHREKGFCEVEERRWRLVLFIEVAKGSNSMALFKSLARLNRFFSEHPLTSDDPFEAWLRFAAWQLRSRLQEEITFKWVGGQRLIVRRDMTGATGNIYVGLHEFFDMIVPIHLLRSGDLFLDIGANVGTYTVLASGVCRANTFAFEPDPGAASHLGKNIDVNRLSELVVVYQCAIGATKGVIPFTIEKDTENRIATEDDKQSRMVRMERLDDIIVDSFPIMMKADVEGAELDVLLGAERLLPNPCLKVIELETAEPESFGILARHGFERACYDPFSRSLSRTSVGRNTSNFLFARDWAFVEARLKSAQEVSILGRRI